MPLLVEGTTTSTTSSLSARASLGRYMQENDLFSVMDGLAQALITQPRNPISGIRRAVDDVLLQYVMQHYDTDRSGKIELSELKAILGDLFSSVLDDGSGDLTIDVSESTAAKVFEAIDVDGDKSVDLAELTRWWTAQAAPILRVVGASPRPISKSRVEQLVDVSPRWVSLLGRLLSVAPHLHTRVYDMLEKVVDKAEREIQSSKDGDRPESVDLDAVSKIIAQMCSPTEGASVGGDLSKFGDDLQQPNANHSALKCLEIYASD